MFLFLCFISDIDVIFDYEYIQDLSFRILFIYISTAGLYLNTKRPPLKRTPKRNLRFSS